MTAVEIDYTDMVNDLRRKCNREIRPESVKTP